MFPITFRFIIPLTWCHHRPNYIFMKSLDNCVVIIISILSSSRVSRIHDEKYHPFPWWFVLSSTTLLPSIQHKLVCVLCSTLSSLLSSICFYLPWSITIFYVKDVVRTAPPLNEFLVLWYFSPSPFFLGPRVDSNRDTNTWTMLLGFCTSSNPIALKLMVDISFLDHWLSNHHSNIDLAT